MNNQAVNITTSPNKLANVDDRSVDSRYKPLCPTGFVDPDDPDSEEHWMVERSGCAVACQMPIYTPSEWKFFLVIQQVISGC